MSKTFWSHFEEPIGTGRDCGFKTQTRQREEPDETPFGLHAMKTITATREEVDQDCGNHGYATMSRANALKTVTESREELDQRLTTVSLLATFGIAH